MAPASLLSSYEALNVYCPEYDLPVATEYRDGNVKPGHGQLEQLQGVFKSQNFFFAFFQPSQILKTLMQPTQNHIVQTAGRFLSVSCDKRDGRRQIGRASCRERV